VPYKLRKSGRGEVVVSPNHPKGFSKKPLSHRQAVAQLRAILISTKGK
jgi:hypothetical protein